MAWPAVSSPLGHHLVLNELSLESNDIDNSDGALLRLVRAGVRSTLQSLKLYDNLVSC